MSKEEGFLKSLRNPLYRPKKEIVPSLPRILQCIVSAFSAAQALAKKHNRREISLQRMNKKTVLDFEEGKKP